MSKNYEPGATVIDHRGTTVTVKSIPFTAHWVQEDGGDEYIAVASDLREPPTDPRVEAAAKGIREGMLRRGAARRAWDDMTDPHREMYRDMARDALAALDAMEPSAPASTPVNDDPQRVIDRDGDTWEMQPDGMYKCVAADNIRARYLGMRLTHAGLADSYGPLRSA
ncbi:hypothetical protein [Streptomyces sp. NPDC007063]|uniref:hypothetical protein n=1 Tax=Streptomyces sp. NPDC007063 TaxID=3364772 RepID=UPI00369EAECD